MIIDSSIDDLEFQSTPSVGRATCDDARSLRRWKRFQSTPSVGRATAVFGSYADAVVISIHALRGEGDSALPYIKIYGSDFNPRPPWGGRPVEVFVSMFGETFQSTPSVGRATNRADSAGL